MRRSGNDDLRDHPSERAPYPPTGSTDPHYEWQGETAEDGSGTGEGEEGFRAEDYPGHNRLRGEGARTFRARVRHAWEAPGDDEADGIQDPPGGRLADARILVETCRRLSRIGIDCGDLEVAVCDGEVRLEGELHGRDACRFVEGVCSTVAGVQRVESHLRCV